MNYERTSDLLLKETNFLYESKNTGTLPKNLLAKIISKIGDLAANKVKMGKMTEEEAFNMLSFISQFKNGKVEDYFSFEHSNEDMKTAVSTFYESINMALSSIYISSLDTMPVQNANKRIGIR